ncbi:MAG: FAD-dependent oxidoreductase, partial [FCB group bacterium]|nr:FAD-dependent oxidoreductase [FCB group bacterium]
MPTLTIDGQAIEYREGDSILDAADAAGVYIPRMCGHPDLTPIGDLIWSVGVYQTDVLLAGEKPEVKAADDAHCNLCLVAVEGRDEPVNSCHTTVENGMVVRTDTEEVIRLRKKALSRILADHPHACLTCAQKEGCSRTDCSSNVPVEERCCVLLGHCELEKVSDYIGIPGDTPRFVPSPKTPAPDDPLFERDYSLCIGCLRCVRICQKFHNHDILGAIWKEDRALVGTLGGGGMKEAQCRFCGACVEICPTGALLDKDGVPAVHRDSPLPCIGNCPAGINIPGYLRAIAAGQFQLALDIIRTSVPFPGILGYVCFHPCEDNCRRSELDQAVAICDLKRFAAEAEIEAARKVTRKPDTGKKAAIIGSGPAGLTAAYYLAGQGHQVSLFDRESKPGGMLRYGIPDYRLPPDVLDRELTVLDDLDIDLHLNHSLESKRPLEELKAQGFDAILVTTGSSAGKVLPLENSELEGIYGALDFLKSAKQSQEPCLTGPVVIIGGGNVAIDAAMTALRLGASPVQLVCLENRDEMPAHGWEIAQAEEEGIEIHPSWGPKNFMADNDRLNGIELKKCTRVFDEQGHFDPRYDDSEIRRFEAETIIIAIGQEVDSDFLSGEDFQTNGHGGVLKIDDSFALGPKGVFAAGDATRGPSSVIDAIADGRKVADIMDRYLGGNGLTEDDLSADKL